MATATFKGGVLVICCNWKEYRDDYPREEWLAKLKYEEEYWQRKTYGLDGEDRQIASYRCSKAFEAWNTGGVVIYYIFSRIEG